MRLLCARRYDLCRLQRTTAASCRFGCLNYHFGYDVNAVRASKNNIYILVCVCVYRNIKVDFFSASLFCTSPRKRSPVGGHCVQPPPHGNDVHP